MKKRLASGYTFTAASKTITHADFSDITLAGIQLITNVTDGIIIYNFADSAKGGTLATDTLTLEYDTTSMSDTDELMILVEDGVATQGVTASSLPLPTGASTSANQSIIIGHVDGIETLLGTIDADTGNISTKIDTIAGAVSGTEVQVDVLTMPTTTVQATNLDIRDLTQTSDAVAIYGSDDGGTTKRIIKTDAGGAIQVDLEVASVAVTSIAAGDNNIGNVDVVSSALPTGASTLAEQQSQTTHLATIAGDTAAIETAVQLLDDTVATDGAATPTKGILMAGQDGTNAQTIRTDSDGYLQVDVLTMPSTTVTATDLDIRNLTATDVVTAELSATDNAVLDAIAASVAAIDTDATTIIGHVDGIETVLGTIDTDTGNIVTSVQLLDDTVYTDGTGTVSKGIAVFGQDGTNPQAIKTDANGELQVDVLTMPTVTVTATNLDIRDIDAATDDITVHGDVGVLDQFDLTNSNPIAVAIVDATGDQISSFGGGTQYTEDAAAAANPVGTVPMLVRKDTPSSEVTTDGDNVAQRGTTYGAAYVTLLDTSGSPVSVGGGTQYDEDAAHSTGAKVTLAGVVRQDTATQLAGTDGDYSLLINDANGRLHVLDANSAAIKTAVETIDNAIAGSEMQVDVVTSALPSGASTLAEQESQTTHLATIAGDTTSIQTAVELLDDTVATDGAATPTKGILIAGQDGTNAQTIKTDVDGNLQVDVLTMPTTTVTATDLDIRNLTATDVVTAELSATDNAVLDAIAASVAAIDTDATTIIGHVDGIETVLGTIDADTGNISTKVDTIATPVATIGSTPLQRVAIFDAANTQITSFGGGTQYTEADTDASITGTAMMMEGAANALVPAQGTAADGLLVNLGANNDVTVSGVSTLAEQQTQTTHLATIAGDTTAIQTAVELLDDTVATLGTTTYTEAATKGLIIGAVRRDADTTLANTTNEVTPLQVDANGYLKVEIFDGGGSHTVDNNGTFVVQENGAALTALQLIDDTIFTDDTSTHTPATTKVIGIGMVADDTSTDSVNEGDIGMPRMTLDRKVVVHQQPNATGGWTTKNCTSSDGSTALTNSAQAIKASAGSLGGWYIYNPNSVAAYVQLYNTAAASVTVGTTNPLFMVTIPPGSAANVEFAQGIAFSNAGWSAAATSTAGGNGALTTAIDAVFFYV